MTPKWTERPWPLPPPGEDVAHQLEAAAELIDAQPGLNVLDAFSVAHHRVRASDLLMAQTYYELLAYLPPEVEYLAPWCDRETPDRVATKLRQLARTIRKGGPARISATPAPAADPALEVVRNAGDHPKPGKPKGVRIPGPDAPRAEQLRYEAGRIRTRLGRIQSGQRPDPAKVTKLGDRLVAIGAELDQLEAAAADETRPPPAGGVVNGRLVGLAGVRRPGLESGL